MTKINKKDTKDFVWNAVGLTLNAFNSLFFLIAVKLVNGIDEAGIFTYAFSLCCLFYIVALFYNRTYQVSENKDDFCFWDYLVFRLVSSGISIILIFVFCLVSQFDWEKIIIILGLMGFRTIEAVSDCFYGEMQKNNKLYKSGISLSIKAILGILTFLFIDVITKDLMLSILGLIVVNILIFFVYDFAQVKDSLKEKVSLSKQNVRNLFKITWPVFVFSVLASLLGNCQKYIMTYFTPNDIQAIFGIIIMPATMISLVGSYLINPFTRKLVEYKKNKKTKQFNKMVRRLVGALCGIGIIGVFVCALIGIPLLNFIYQMSLDEYFVELIIIVASAIIYAIGMLLSSIMTILERNKSQVLIYGIAVAIAIVSGIILIPKIGIDGAVWSYLLSSVILSGGFVVVFVRNNQKKTNE